MIRTCSLCTGFVFTFHSSIYNLPSSSSSLSFYLREETLGHFHQSYFETVLTVLSGEDSVASLAGRGEHGPLSEGSPPTWMHRPVPHAWSCSVLAAPRGDAVWHLGDAAAR